MSNLLKILSIVGSLGVFMFGMKLVSESIQKAAGHRLRNLLSALTASRFRSFFTGLLVTGAIHSSSAVSVMIISFVNAGQLSVYQAVGAIIGANVGTTITAWILALLGFKLSLDPLLLPIIGLAIPLYFTKKGSFRKYGEFLFGFALVFLGLEFLKQHFAIPAENIFLTEGLTLIKNLGFGSVLLFLLAGLVTTVVIQSSSASFVLIVVMCFKGWIGLDLAIAMILGSNIGTTSSAIIASLPANRSAKRTALAHLIFNLIGIAWALIIFRVSVSAIEWLTLKISGASPIPDNGTVAFALSLYHTLFNFVNAALLIGFIPLIVRLTEILLPKGSKKERFTLQHLTTPISTSELSLLQAKKLVGAYGLRTEAMFEFIPQLLVEKDPLKYGKLLRQIKKYEDNADNMEDEIEIYLNRLSESEMSRESYRQVHSMFKVIDNLETINDVCMKMSTLMDIKNSENAWFTQEMRDELNEMFSLIFASLALTNHNIEHFEVTPDMSKVLELESKIDILRNVLLSGNNKRVQDNSIAYNTAKYYGELISLCEKIGDMTLNINEALAEKT